MKRIRVSPWTTSLAALVWLLLLSPQRAGAEIVLLDKDGWQVFTEGRVGAFASEAVGQGVPPPADPARPLIVGIFGSPNAQEDTSNNVMAFRLRSGMMPNILAFGFRKDVSENTTLRGYISIWASADTNRVKYTKSAIDVRQGYLTLDGRWGSLLAGRALSLFARGNYEIDVLYQHGFGFGHPCRLDSTGEEAGFNGGGTCGQIGFGVLHPGYDAGISYATPNLGGLRLTVGIYDPIGSQSTFPRTPFPRPEGELAFERKFGMGMVRVFASGFWQRSQKLIPDPADPTGVTELLINRDAWGFAGGARLELGPLRLGGSGFRGKGTGTHFALNGTNDQTTFSSTTFNYRDTAGFHAALAGVFGRYMVNAGFGMTQVSRLTPEDTDPVAPILPRRQYGIAAGFNARISEQLVYAIDFFRAHSEWYDNTKQDINFISSGLVLVW